MMSGSETPHKLNANNVFVTFETIVISKSKTLNVEILLAECDGIWYAGYKYQKGHCAVGDYYGGAYPSKNNNGFINREAAINHQLSDFEAGRNEVANAARQFRQPSLFPNEIFPKRGKTE